MFASRQMAKLGASLPEMAHRECVVMNVNRLALLALLVACGGPTDVGAQSEERNATLVNTDTGLVEANPDGTQATSTFVVPAGQQLCVRDIAWYLEGMPGAEASLGLFNTNIDGVTFYQ